MRKAFFAFLFCVFSFYSWSNDSLVVVKTNDKVDTLVASTIKGVVYRDRYFIQGKVIRKTEDSFVLNALYLDSLKNERDTVMEVLFSDVSAIVYKREVKSRFVKRFFTKTTTSKISRGVLTGGGALAIILTNYEEASFKSYLVPIIVVPVAIIYHAIIVYDASQTKKIKLKKGISVIH